MKGVERKEEGQQEETELSLDEWERSEKTSEDKEKEEKYEKNKNNQKRKKYPHTHPSTHFTLAWPSCYNEEEEAKENMKRNQNKTQKERRNTMTRG